MSGFARIRKGFAVGRRAKLLLVDGYNVLRSGSRYRTLVGEDYTPDAFNRKREALLNDVATFAGREYEAVVVFDGAANAASVGSEEQIGGVRIVFTPAGVSADRVIERMARTARDLLRETLVVSSDAAIQDTVFSLCVTRMSANGFCRELDATFEENNVTFTPRPAKKNKLADRLGAEAAAVLRALRDSL